MEDTAYRYKINAIKLKDGIPFSPGRINVFVGANNCGKTQLLKDMLGYITGTQANAVVLDELDITYPDTWEAMEKAYAMKFVETNHGKKLRHISPTLDQDPSGPMDHDILSLLSYWLSNDSRAFRSATGAGMVTFLNTDNRLKLVLSQTVKQDLQSRGPKNVLETLYASGSTTMETVRKYIRDIFGVDVFLNPFNLGTLEFRIGSDFSAVSKEPQDAYKELGQYQLIDIQGDGIRSVLGMISAIVSAKKPIVLLDEPEAFLHPPQALQLGEIINEIVGPDQQIFIATHSSDFLRGLLGSTKDAVIIHLNRTENNTVGNVLDAETLNQIVADPLLSSARVLDGMFYKGVVATEADADAVFYQRVFQKIGASDEVHFVNAHNKQTLKKIIIPYKKLGIRFAMIADADVIRDKHDIDEILEITTDTFLKEQIYHDREKILEFFQTKSKYEVLCELVNNTLRLVDETETSADSSEETISRTLFVFRLKLKKLRDESDDLAEFKKLGKFALSPELQVNFDNLWTNCASIGLFIVTVGELESWLVDYGTDRTSNKSKWISSALRKLFEIDYDENKEIWRFVEKLKTYLCS